MTKPTKKQLEELAKQIEQDQSKEKPAEKRISVKSTFRGALKRMAQTKLPKKK